MTEEELTLLIRTVAGAGFIISQARQDGDYIVLTVRTPPPRIITK